MKNKILEMFSLQEQLNNNTNGIDWKSGITNKERLINWNRCIYMEISEFIESFNWKHWKNINGTIDYENAKIELVDVWHFLMSEILKNNYSLVEINKIVLDTYESIYIQKDDKYTETIIKLAEDVMRDALSIQVSIDSYVRHFITLTASFGLSFDELYLLYIGKNCLNEFRQNNGYKEGTYSKMHNGLEDNVIMQNILNRNPNISYSKLYDQLEKQVVQS
jgi:dimeric dUTPase (all-alpha-NTP-PPase superfamily)